MKIIKLTGGLALLCVTAFTSLAQSANNFTINGTLKNMPAAPKTVFLYIGAKLADSTLAHKCQYHFKGKIDSVTHMRIALGHIPKNEVFDMATVYVDKGDFNIVSDGTVDNFTVSGSGSKVTDDFRAATKRARVTGDSLKKIAYQPGFKTDLKLQQDWRIAMSNIAKPMNDEMVVFLKAHPTTPAGKMMMEVIGALPFTDPDTIDSLLRTLPETTQAPVKAGVLANSEKRRVAERAKKEKELLTPVGSEAKDFTMNDTQGKPVSLASFKGKYVLIDFWASWCGPCRGENPNVVKAYQQYKGKGFDIIGVSLDAESTKEAWLKAIQTDGLSWTEVSDLKGWSNAAAKAYGVTAIPQNYLIDPNGIVIAKNLRGEELQKKLASLFNK